MRESSSRIWGICSARWDEVARSCPDRRARLSEHVAAFFTSGHAADLVLLVLIVETIVLAFLSRLRSAALIAATLPGALIVLALRAALLGQRWPMVALPLALAWPAHLWDVRLRLNQRR